MKKSSLGAIVLALCFAAPSILLIGCRENSPTESPNPSFTESFDGSLESSFEEADSNSSSNSSSNDSSTPSQESSSSTSPPNESSSKEEEEVTPPPKPAKASYIQCVGDNVNIRSGAGTNYSILGQAEAGTMYAVISKTGNWYKTYYKNKIAYLYASYTSVFTLEKTENKVEDVIEEGYKLLGVPYVYGAVRLHDGTGRLLGGFTAQKFDCSSLIQYIFYKGANKLLGVHTRAQVLQGEYVKPDELRRGDCIFFTNEQRQYNKGIERVGHVALYLGDGYILHTASDYARIEKMSNKRWSFYIEARRFL